MISDALKIMAILAVGAVFMVAIYNLIYLFSEVVLGGVISETFALISMYLPFDAGAVFSGLGAVCSAILSFLVSKKIFDLTSWSINSA